MDNTLIDDRRIHVDFSQSVAKLWGQYRHGKRTNGSKEGCFKCGATDHIARDCDQGPDGKSGGPKYVLKDENTQRGGDDRRRYDMVFDEDNMDDIDGKDRERQDRTKKRKTERGSHDSYEHKRDKDDERGQGSRRHDDSHHEKYEDRERRRHHESSRDKGNDRDYQRRSDNSRGEKDASDGDRHRRDEGDQRKGDRHRRDEGDNRKRSGDGDKYKRDDGYHHERRSRDVEENKKMVFQLQCQLATVMEFIRQTISDCNLGGSCQIRKILLSLLSLYLSLLIMFLFH